MNDEGRVETGISEFVSLTWAWDYSGVGEFTLELPVKSELADPQRWVYRVNNQYYRPRYLSDGKVVMFPKVSTRRRESDTVVIKGASLKTAIHQRAIINGPAYNIQDPRSLLEGLVRTAVGEAGTGTLKGRSLPVKTRYEGPTTVQGDSRNFEYSGKYIEEVEKPLERLGKFWTRMEMFDYVLDRTENGRAAGRTLALEQPVLAYGYGGSIADYEVTMDFVGSPRGVLALHRKDGDPNKRSVYYGRIYGDEHVESRVGPFYTEEVFDATDFYKWSASTDDAFFKRIMERYATNRLEPNRTTDIQFTILPKSQGGVDLIPGKWYRGALPEFGGAPFFCEKVTRSYSPSGVFQDAKFNTRGVFLGY